MKLFYILIFLLIQLFMVQGRPKNSQNQGYGYWGRSTGIGGKFSANVAESVAANIGVGVHGRTDTDSGSSSHGLNFFGGKQAEFGGNADVALGGYQTGYKLNHGFPNGNHGFPGRNHGLPGGNHGFPGGNGNQGYNGFPQTGGNGFNNNFFGNPYFG